MENFDKLKEDLIYDLIFSKNTDYQIEISRYIKDIYKYDRFIKEIKKILMRSKVSIIMEKVSLSAVGVFWEIKVKK